MSRRSLHVRRISREIGGHEYLHHAMPGDRIKSTGTGPGGEPPSYEIITEPMSERKRSLWFQWGVRK